MGISRYNGEGYSDPTSHAALSGIRREERAAKRAYRPLVYICSPFAGDTEGNMKKARRYSRFAVRSGAIPFAPHLLFPQFIPRASSVSAKSVTMGEEGTVTITRASSSFTHTLKYTFGSVTKTFVTKTDAVSVSWTPPLSLAGQVPNAVSGTCTITCVTYSGSTKIGTKTCTLKLTVPAGVKPTISSLTAARVDGTVPSSWGIYVQSKSKAALAISGAAGAYGSEIASYSITGGGFASSAASFTTGYLNSYGNITFTATVTDSRGRVSAAASVTITVERYFVPYFETYSSQRCGSGGVLSDDGTYVLANVLYNRAPCGNNNTVTRTIQYKKNTDSVWTNAGVVFSSGVPVVFGGGWISTEYSYDIRYTITDAFHTVSVTDIITTAAVVMDFKRGGRGVAIGKVSETDRCFEVSEEWDVKVYGKLLKDYISSIAGSMYPVGSIYMSVTNTNPSAYFGGTWAAWGSGRVPVGVDASDTHILDVQVIGTGSVLRTAVIFFYISNEGVSLVENAGHLGLPVPEKLKEVLEQLHERSGEGSE